MIVRKRLAAEELCLEKVGAKLSEGQGVWAGQSRPGQGKNTRLQIAGQARAGSTTSQ